MAGRPKGRRRTALATPDLPPSDPADLGRLLARAADGDARAFADLYDATAPRLFRLVLVVVGDQESATALARDAYLRIWQTAHAYDPVKGSALSWMAAIAYTIALSARQAAPGATRPRDD